MALWSCMARPHRRSSSATCVRMQTLPGGLRRDHRARRGRVAGRTTPEAGDEWEQEVLTAIRRNCPLVRPDHLREHRAGERRLRLPGVGGGGWTIAPEFRVGRFIVPVIIDEDYDGDPSRYRKVQKYFGRLHFGRAPAGEPDAGLTAMLTDEIDAIRRHRRGMIRTTTRPQLDGENPWPGLESFEEERTRFFFGREREAEALLDHVLDAPVTVLYGRSGLGKTSLLRAGLFPVAARTALSARLRALRGQAGRGATGSPATSIRPRLHSGRTARCGAAVG